MNFSKNVSIYFLGSAISGAISFLMLPVITYVIGPEEWGVYALVMSVVVIVAAFSDVGSGYILGANIQVLDKIERKKLVSSLLIISIIVTMFTCLLILGVWLYSRNRFDIINHFSIDIIWLTLLTMLFSAPWVIAIEVFTLLGKAREFAILNILQSCVWASSVTVFLYGPELGLLSLFWAKLLATISALFGSLYVLRNYLGPHLEFKWLKDTLQIGSRSVLSNVLNNFSMFLERILLSVHVGMAQVGLYTHSQIYRNQISQVIKAVSRSIWPLTLEDARNKDKKFERTKKAWFAVHFGIIILGIGFATFGKEIVSIITHDKFTDAYVYIVFWMAYLLLQNSARPHIGVIYANNAGKHYSNIVSIASIISIVMLFFLVEMLGVIGVFISSFIYLLLLRIGATILARKYTYTPFQDSLVILGMLLILLSYIASTLFMEGLLVRVLVFFFFTSIMIVFYYQEAKAVIKEIKNMMKLKIANV